ncbi:MAG TPA: hypothetical protein VHU61_03015 [Solirubrobacteraceae bacterium]|jgi:hypothetical protein|nr:hypothetical protein [Solirubrobacteraceae bacterium]
MKRPSASLIVATCAVFIALCGGAVAASRYLITSTKQISPAVLKKLEKVGPKGAAGAPGASGTFSPSDVTAVSGPTVAFGSTSTASCPTGDTVISGGFQGINVPIDGAVSTDGPSGTSGWTVRIDVVTTVGTAWGSDGPASVNTQGGDDQFYAQAICAS